MKPDCDMNSIMGHAKDGIIVTDESLKVIYANESSLNIISRQDIVDENIHDVFRVKHYYTGESLNYILDEVLKLGQSKGLVKEATLLTFDNQKIFISASISPVGDAIKGLVIFFKDITRIKKTESELLKFSKAFHESNESMVITDDLWRVEYYNPKALEYHQTETCELGLNFWKCSNYDLSSLQKKSIYSALERDLFWVGEIITHDRKWFRTSIFTMQNEAGDIVNYVISEVDITFEKESRKLLMRERKNLSTIINGTPFGMMTITVDYNVLQINEECKKILGIDIIRNENIKELVLEKSHLDFIVDLSKQVFATGEAIRNYESRIQREFEGIEDKRWIKVNAVGIEISQKKCVLLSFEDETIKKEMAKTIIHNERQLRMITENMQDIITQIDPEGMIEYCSSSYKAMLAYDSPDLKGQSLLKIIYREDRDILRRMIEKCKKQKENLKFEIRFLSKSSEILWVEIMMRYVASEDAESFLLFGRDVTQRRIVEQEVIQSKEMAIAANNAKSEFLANMSHEIRTPLNGIIGMANVSLMQVENKSQKDNIQLIKHSAENLLQIINSVLDFSKIEAGKLILEERAFSLKTNLKNVLKPLRIQASQKEISLNVSLDHHIDDSLEGDVVRSMQILNNIIGNAIKFTEFGSVDFSARVVSEDDLSQTIEYKIKDTGVGIRKEDQDKIFRSFSQADGSVTRRFGGTGLGLNITKRLVELMKGHIEFTSEYGIGTKFICTIPYKRSGSTIKQKNDKVVEAEAKGLGYNILVVEDDPINQKLAQRLLKRKGYGITLVENGQEAVDIYEDHRFDLILMDIQMPVLDGLAATKLIREKAKVKIPIIALTAYAIKGDREKFLKKGMDDYISKPIDLDEFYSILTKHLSKKKKEDHSIQKILDRLSQKQSSVDTSVVEIIDANFDKINMQLKYIASSLQKRNYEKLEERCYAFKNYVSSINLLALRKLVFNLELYIRKENEIKIEESFYRIMDYVKENSSKVLKGVEYENSNR